ncbi:hypothetical protein M885DRAFT_574352 [Pelagophyceae sp. CCMP2097]|nr:hypothetical protein M885DRAFT_574352 [Pelagophyceae sp. CCMP2097]
MGSSASSTADPIVDPAGNAVPRATFSSVEKTYRAKLGDCADSKARDALGADLLRAEKFSMTVVDAGSWTRVVVRDLSANEPAAATQPSTSHLAFLATQALVQHARGNTLTVVHVEADDGYLKTMYKLPAVRLRYKNQLAALPPQRRRFLSLPSAGVVACVAVAFVNQRDSLLAHVRSHPDPTLAAFGACGRGARADRDPATLAAFVGLASRPAPVLGTVADHVVKHYAGNVVIFKAVPLN